MKKLARTKSEQFNKWTARSFQRPPHTSHPGTRRDYSQLGPRPSDFIIYPDWVSEDSDRARSFQGRPYRPWSYEFPGARDWPRPQEQWSRPQEQWSRPQEQRPRPQEQRPHPHQQTSHLPITSEQTPNRAQRLQSSPPYRRANPVTPGPTQSCNYKEAERVGEAQPSVGLPILSVRQGCEPYMYHGDAQAFSQRTPRAAYSLPRLAYSAYSLGSPGGLPGIGRSSWAGPGHRHGPVWA